MNAPAWGRIELDPADLGLKRASLDDLRGGDAAHNAGIARRIRLRSQHRPCHHGPAKTLTPPEPTKVPAPQ